MADELVHVIDDDPAVRDSLAFLLETANLSPRTYDSAVAFLEALPEVTSGCVVTDVRMPEMTGIELVRRLKNHGYCVYYLSNIPQDVLELLTERGVLAQFDGGVASCEVQVNKPDPQIYKALLKKYQLKASECVFIDDRLENVQAAFALGFAGIQMKDSVGTLIRSLATCNVTLR